MCEPLFSKYVLCTCGLSPCVTSPNTNCSNKYSVVTWRPGHLILVACYILSLSGNRTPGCVSFFDTMDATPLLTVAKLFAARHLPRDVALEIHKAASLLPPTSVDNSKLPDFLATWVSRDRRLCPIWDDMSWERQRRESVHGRHVRLRMALEGGFAVPEDRIWCEWHESFFRPRLL